MDDMWRLESFKHTSDQQEGIPNTSAFCADGTAELKINIGFMSNGPKEMSLQLEKKIFLMKVCCLLTKYIINTRITVF